MIFPELRQLPLGKVMVHTVNEFINDEMSTYASALAYQMLFSLFPFLLFLIALIGFLHLPDFFSWLRLQSELVLPPQALEQVNPVIDQLQQSKGGLLSVGIVIALGTASAGVRLMMSAMNAAYDVVEDGQSGSVSLCRFSTPWVLPGCCWLLRRSWSPDRK